MKVGISLKIDVTKIDKARLFKGEKGTYMDLQAFVDLDEAGQYGDHGFITHQPTKEERERKEQLPILGNVKVFWKEIPDEQRAQQYDTGGAAAKAAMADEFNDDDIPF